MKAEHDNSTTILGQAGAVLAACIQFLALPILSTFIFAVFVAAELWNRRRT